MGLKSINADVCVQLQDLVCEILRGHLTMFRKDTLLSVLS